MSLEANISPTTSVEVLKHVHCSMGNSPFEN